MSSPYPPSYIRFPSEAPARQIPRPPGLHWGWVLALNIITVSFFGIVWLLVQSIWVRRVRGRSTAFIWAILHAAFVPLLFVSIIGVAIVMGATGNAAGYDDFVHDVDLPIRLAIAVLYLCTVFTLKSELEAEPIGIPLSGVMTFFFGPIYFQYFLHDWDRETPSGYGTLNLSQPGR
jgi:hypothetical protein